MKTTLEIPNELYRQAKVKAASENLKMKDLVSEGLRLVLGQTKKDPRLVQGRTDAPGKTRLGSRPPALLEGEQEETAGREEASRRKALAVMEEIRRNPAYPPERVQEMVEETNRLRKEGWNRGDLGE